MNAFNDPTGIVQGLGKLYLGLIFVLVIVALWLPKRWWQKALGMLIVLAIFIGPAILRDRHQFAAQVNTRYAQAKTLFDERCKTAGETIFKTVDEVDGVLLLNIRGTGMAENRANPNWPDAGVPNEFGGQDYIESFISWEHHQFPKEQARGALSSHPTSAYHYHVSSGYKFVDVKESDNTVYRYQYSHPPENAISKEAVKGKLARYAVSFINMIDPADRATWVAGTSISIVDTLTQELLAKKTFYSFEPGLGSTAGERSPWGSALTCPEIKGQERRTPTRFFVDQVLRPEKERLK